jgi:hypothetical protein
MIIIQKDSQIFTPQEKQIVSKRFDLFLDHKAAAIDS